MKAITILVLTGSLVAQERIDQATNERIQSEATAHSQAMQLAHVLSDRYGPRLTGSPSYAAAAKWAVAELTNSGYKARSGAIRFRVRWLGERHAYGYLTAPVRQNLVFQMVAWTASTNGRVSASIVQLVRPENPTRDEMTRWLNEIAPRVRGRIVMVGKARAVPIDLRPFYQTAECR